ncbi:MAG: hypothetical protein EXR55_04435 [Dehalococcoidia bacterium]|nr:hypothetical protein [Dehalococcoidia bacterium]
MKGIGLAYRLLVTVSMVVALILGGLILSTSRQANAQGGVPPPPPSVIVVLEPGVATTVDASAVTKARVRVLFPAQTFSAQRLVEVREAPVGQIPTPTPPGIGQTRSAFEINVFLPSGAQETRPALGQCITVTASYSDADVAAAGSPFALAMMRYDSAVKAWILLTTRIDVVAGILSAQVCSSLSTFAVGVQGPPLPPTPVPPTATARPPIPGDFSPPSNFLVGLMVAGVVLALSGGFYLRTARREDRL